TNLVPGWTQTTSTGFAFIDALPADVNGDGLSDLVVEAGSTDVPGRGIWVSLSGTLHKVLIEHPGDDAERRLYADGTDLMTSVENGIGGIVTASYESTSALPDSSAKNTID